MAGKNGGGIGGTAPAYKMDMSEMAARAACDYSRGVWRRGRLVGPVYVAVGIYIYHSTCRRYGSSRLGA
jgi:hypothetical protein